MFVMDRLKPVTLIQNPSQAVLKRVFKINSTSQFISYAVGEDSLVRSIGSSYVLKPKPANYLL